MDYALSHTLDAFSTRHDGFETLLAGYVGAAELIFAAVVAVLFLLGREWRRSAVAAAASAAAALLVAHFLSVLVDRPRPFVAHAATIHPFLAHAADASFPSDHATAAFAIAVAVTLRRRRLGGVLLVMAAVLAAGRVFLGLHYPSDVLAGAALGTAAALLLWLPAPRALLERVAAVPERIGRRRPAAA